MNVTSDTIIIIGIPKCGTVSFQNYLLKKYPEKNINRIEKIYEKGFHKEFESGSLKGCQPAIIVRDPVERIWSAYCYFDWAKPQPFEQWIKKRHSIEHTGTANPLESVQYEKYIEPYLHLNPIIVRLEDMVKEPDFPHDNKTIKKRPIPDDYRKLIIAHLNDRYDYFS